MLKRLAPHERGIADTDLTFLWNLTQKVVLNFKFSADALPLTLAVLRQLLSHACSRAHDAAVKAAEDGDMRPC